MQFFCATTTDVAFQQHSEQSQIQHVGVLVLATVSRSEWSAPCSDRHKKQCHFSETLWPFELIPASAGPGAPSNTGMQASRLRTVTLTSLGSSDKALG